jgi:hypothetical protein
MIYFYYCMIWFCYQVGGRKDSLVAEHQKALVQRLGPLLIWHHSTPFNLSVRQ